MSETSHLVTVRVRTGPSGETSIGEFMVSGERVRAQGGFARQLMGEVAESRFRSLCSALGVEPQLS